MARAVCHVCQDHGLVRKHKMPLSFFQTYHIGPRDGFSALQNSVATSSYIAKMEQCLLQVMARVVQGALRDILNCMEPMFSHPSWSIEEDSILHAISLAFLVMYLSHAILATSTQLAFALTSALRVI
jgi:hypothetical protein